ncbi:hypothetical protein C8Q72DRAFT_378063 [Fomitopsis betulina]|nr:hypothetical protein C8Q72DRAFT_378063 [Fomitopsis betulina]
MAELLHRSGNAPLTINATMSKSLRKGREDSLELVLGELCRVRWLHLHAVHCLTRKTVHLLAGPAPLLQELYLSGMLGGAYTPNLVDFPRMLHPKNTPSLRSLSVLDARLGIKLKQSCTRTLRDLTVHMSPTPLFPWPNLTELMDVLRMMPSLRTLDLVQHGMALSHGIAADPPRVTLPHVHRFTLQAGLGDCLRILNALDLPSLFCVCVSIQRIKSPRVQELAPILRNKTSYINSVRKLVVESFAKDDDWGIFRLKGYRRRNRSSTVRAQPSFTFTFQYGPGHLDDVRTMLPETFAGKHITTMVIEGEHIDESMWRNLTASASNTQVLIVSGHAAAHLLPLFRVEEPHLAAQTSVLPKLYRLSFYNARLVDTNVLQELHSNLLSRAAAGISLNQLEFFRCSGLDQPIVASLQHAVKRVSIERCDGMPDSIPT